jgi:hypothetical protein
MRAICLWSAKFLVKAQLGEMVLNKEVILHGTEIKPGIMQTGEVSKESQAVEDFGGPCRGRTYGPLIKSLFLPFLRLPLGSSVS